jgi:hypothetical protein
MALGGWLAGALKDGGRGLAGADPGWHCQYHSFTKVQALQAASGDGVQHSGMVLCSCLMLQRKASTICTIARPAAHLPYAQQALLSVALDLAPELMPPHCSHMCSCVARRVLSAVCHSHCCP